MICYGCNQPINQDKLCRFRGEPVHREFPDCTPRDEVLECPECGSTDTVKVWDDAGWTDPPDYLRCNECPAGMIPL